MIAIFSGTLQLLGHLRYAKSRGDHPKWWLVLRVIQTQLATIPFVVAALCLSLDLPGALYWLAPGFALSFISGVVHAWILLIEILR